MPKKKIKKTIKKWKQYSKISGVGSITRRYFVMNAFDGALTMLGVVIGAYVSGILYQSTVIISAGIAGSIAMGASGVSGAYMTEKAERTKKLKKLEKAMLSDMKNGLHGKSHRFATIFAAIVDGSAPFIASIPALIPFILVPSLLNIQIAFVLSILANMSTLFSLGVYLGKISGENILISGAKMVVSGIAVAIIALLLNVH